MVLSVLVLGSWNIFSHSAHFFNCNRLDIQQWIAKSRFSMNISRGMKTWLNMKKWLSIEETYDQYKEKPSKGWRTFVYWIRTCLLLLREWYKNKSDSGILHILRKNLKHKIPLTDSSRGWSGSVLRYMRVGRSPQASLVADLGKRSLSPKEGQPSTMSGRFPNVGFKGEYSVILEENPLSRSVLHFDVTLFQLLLGGKGLSIVLIFYTYLLKLPSWFHNGFTRRNRKGNKWNTSRQ